MQDGKPNLYVCSFAYLTLRESDQNSFKEVEYVRFAMSEYSAWRVLYSCFFVGAWSCLSQDMDFRARHVLYCTDGGCAAGVLLGVI